MMISSTTARRMMGLLRDVAEKQNLILKKQEKMMAKQAEASAAMDALEAKFDEIGAGILHEIEQLKAAKESGDGMSSTEVEAMIGRMTALGGKVQTSVDALKADD